MDCGKITAAFVGGACGKLPIGGTGTRVALFNYADIASYDTTDDGVIESLALVQGAKGYLFETIENSPQGDATFEQGTYVSAYTHQVTLRIFKDNIAARAWCNSMKDARLVAIVERREAGEAHWEVYGIESGLKLSENTYSTSYSDNVVLAPVLASDDTSKESALPAIYFVDSPEATTASVLALANGESIGRSAVNFYSE